MEKKKKDKTLPKDLFIALIPYHFYIKMKLVWWVSWSVGITVSTS